MDNNDLKKQNRLMKKPVPKTPEERSETEEIILDNFCDAVPHRTARGLFLPTRQAKRRLMNTVMFIPMPCRTVTGYPIPRTRKRLTGKRVHTAVCEYKRLSAYACRQPLFTSYFQVHLSPYRVTVRPHTQL